MTKTIQVPMFANTQVGTTEIKLPFYFTSGDHVKSYCCMNEQFNLIIVYRIGHSVQIESKHYDDADDVAFRLERESRDKLYAPIDEAVFMHQFSEVHRELFYRANPQLKPIE
jgi:hypothetical protein